MLCPGSALRQTTILTPFRPTCSPPLHTQSTHHRQSVALLDCATPSHFLKAPHHHTILIVMAMLTRGQARRAQPPPPFILLPDLAHATIASFLPDGNNKGVCADPLDPLGDIKTDNRLRVSEVCRALHDSYGGSVTSASLYYADGRSSSLVALLRRQKKLRTLVVKG